MAKQAYVVSCEMVPPEHRAALGLPGIDFFEQKAFAELDENGDGVISMEELKFAFKNLLMTSRDGAALKIEGFMQNKQI